MPIRKLKDNAPKADPVQADPVLPSAADLDAVAAEQKTAEATMAKPDPLSTPPADVPVVEQTSAPAAAPDSLAAPSFRVADPNVNWTDPHLNTVQKDSLGNQKTDLGAFGPKGDAPPPDVMTAEQRQGVVDAEEKKMQQHMASTVGVDSVGRPKGHFHVTPQGFDEHGMRKPDLVDTSRMIESGAVHVGPRGQGAPRDSFHGAKPAQK